MQTTRRDVRECKEQSYNTQHMIMMQRQICKAGDERLLTDRKGLISVEMRQQGTIAHFCRHVNEPSVSINWEFLEQRLFTMELLQFNPFHAVFI
jgi:hypothetical protein